MTDRYRRAWIGHRAGPEISLFFPVEGLLWGVDSRYLGGFGSNRPTYRADEKKPGEKQPRMKVGLLRRDGEV